MRKPKQVLVFLYRKNKDNYEYCIFLRKKGDFWQAISGGVEDDESLVDTVKREVYEETGFVVNSVLELSSISSIPVISIAKDFIWGSDVYVALEYSFGVLCDGDIFLSDEHSKYKWVSYSDAVSCLKYDSNKTALWELNERLNKN